MQISEETGIYNHTDCHPLLGKWKVWWIAPFSLHRSDLSVHCSRRPLSLTDMGLGEERQCVVSCAATRQTSNLTTRRFNNTNKLLFLHIQHRSCGIHISHPVFFRCTTPSASSSCMGQFCYYGKQFISHFINRHSKQVKKIESTNLDLCLWQRQTVC